MTDSTGPVFYLDLGSPECLLSAERILGVMPVATEWVPVHLNAPATASAIDALSWTAAARGLQPMRRPEPFPFDAELANRAATYAKQIGRTVAFAQAALRQAYAGGRALDSLDNIVIAASACEMHPRAVAKAVQTRGVIQALADATETARLRGVTSAPAVWIPGLDAFIGDAALQDAADQLAAAVSS